MARTIPTSLLAMAAAVMFHTAFAAEALTLSSPNDQVQFRLLLEEDRLAYTVTLGSRAVIDSSLLGITVDGINLAQGIELGRPARYRTNETYPWYGVHSTAVDRSNGVKLPVKHKASGASYTFEVRAYDDGIAFRHIVAGSGGQTRIPDEATNFKLPAGSIVWYHDFEGHYEALHTKKEIGQVSVGEWAAPPVTFKLPANGGYGSITEGALVDYAGMGLQADGKGGFDARLGHAHPDSYPFRLRYKDDVERLKKPASIAGTITTPWRIVMLGTDLNTLVNSDIVNHVSPPPDPRLFPKGIGTDRIKPGRAVWKYLDGGGENNLETVKEFSRLASELGFEYQVVEGFWRKWTPAELRDFVDYSRKLGVGILLWQHSNQLRTAGQRKQFFEICRDAGAAGAKLDFYDHEAKEVVDLYEASLKEAAQYRLIINFHGANKPTGLSRTYPNELTREGIRGMESRRSPRATHDATLPFTRMLAGHADYTPVVFGERRNDTTGAHQVATAATFTSPLLIYGAHPKSMLDNPAVEILKSIPAVWDETIVLPGSEIGEVSALARRKDSTWFVAVLNGTTARTLEIPLPFLGSGRYRSIEARDVKDNAAALEVREGAVARGDILKIEMPPGGGFIARLTK